MVNYIIELFAGMTSGIPGAIFGALICIIITILITRQPEKASLILLPVTITMTSLGIGLHNYAFAFVIIIFALLYASGIFYENRLLGPKLTTKKTENKGTYTGLARIIKR